MLCSAGGTRSGEARRDRQPGEAIPEAADTERRAQVGLTVDYLAEAVARSTATGRPFAGHLHPAAAPGA